MSTHTTTPRATQLAQLADFLRSEAADRHEEAPEIAEQLMQLAHQADGLTVRTVADRPSFTAGQLRNILDITTQLIATGHTLPAVSNSERMRWGIFSSVATGRADFITVRSTVGGGTFVGAVATWVAADVLINAFALAAQAEEVRLLLITPPPPAMSFPMNRKQVLDQMAERARYGLRQRRAA